MRELEVARQRISEKEREFESIKPWLLEMEAKIFEDLPPRVRVLFREVKEEIVELEGVRLEERIDFQYAYTDTDHSRIKHVFVNVGEPTQQDWYEQGTRRNIDRIVEPDPFGPKIYQRYIFDWEGRVPEHLFEGLKPKGRDWVSQKVFIPDTYLSYTLEVQGKSGWNGIEFHIFLGKYGKYISFIGPGQKTKEGRSFNLEEEEDLNLFAEELVRFVARKGYIRQDNKDAKSSKKVAPISTMSAAPAEVEPEFPTALEQSDRFSGEELWRRMQEEERDRVLEEIEQRELEDPTYRRPSWISQDERSRKGLMGNITSDRDRFLSEDDFQAGIQRHFPQPPDRG